MTKRDKGQQRDHAPAEDDGDEVPESKVVRIKLVANVEDESNKIAYNEYRFLNLKRKWVKLRVERAKTVDASQLARELLNKNADLPTDAAERKLLLAELVAQKPHHFRRLAAKVGWVEGKAIFVRHTGVSGDALDDTKLLPPSWVQDARHRGRIAGTLDEWKRGVAPIIRWSSRFQLTSAAAFAAPLVRLVKLQPFAVVIHGQSSVGKSSAVLVAGSIVGFGSKEDIPNWNLSNAGLHETACRLNDHLFPIDEIGAMDLPRSEMYNRVRTVTFSYAEGADATRHSRSGFATSQDQSDAKGIMITTSEHSFDKLAELCGQKRDDGELARAFDVPAKSPGFDTVFDIFPTSIGEAARAAWIKGKFDKIRTSCPEQHGTAFRRYLKFLTKKDRILLIEQVRGDMEEFERALDLNTEVPALQHAARNFSVIYAGGAQAIEAKLLPVSKRRLLRSIIKCFRDGAGSLPNPGALQPAAVEQLAKGLASTVLPRKEDLDLQLDSDPIGFRRPFSTADKTTLFAIRPATFHDWFLTDEHYQVALRWLKHNDLLQQLSDTAKVRNAAVIDPISFEKISGRDGQRKNIRWIRFRDPRPAIKAHAARAKSG